MEPNWLDWLTFAAVLSIAAGRAYDKGWDVAGNVNTLLSIGAGIVGGIQLSRYLLG